MKRLIFTFLLLVSMVIHAGLSMQVDVFKVTLGESFRATLTLDGASASGVPDLTPLQKDFSIVGTERSTSYSIINGQSSSTSQWILLLMPKRAGMLTVPSIQLGQDKTQALQIEVAESNTPTSVNDAIDQHKDVMLVADASTLEPYVNEQVVYTVKLYNSKRLLDASYQPPAVEDALIIPLGDTRHYQSSENGQIYNVEEQRYAIFPQKSGELKIVSPVFNALIYRAVPEQIKVIAPPVTLKVKPAPANFKGNAWAPAKQIILSDVYDRGGASVTEGSTLVRTITMQAAGLPAQLLPAMPIENGEGFSVYSDKPVENNKLDQGELTATRTIRVTYLFNKAGKVVIPTQQLHWFNTVTQKEEIASIPEQTMLVLASANSGNQGNTVEKAVPSSTQESKTTTEPAAQLPILSAPAQKTSDTVAWWLAGGFALAWVVTLILWWWRPNLSSNGGQKRALKQLQQACTSNHPELARTALLCWASQQWPDAPLSNLGDITVLTHDSELNKHINGLSKALYQSKPRPWQGEALWRCVMAYKKTRSETNKKDTRLPPINPA